MPFYFWTIHILSLYYVFTEAYFKFFDVLSGGGSMFAQKTLATDRQLAPWLTDIDDLASELQHEHEHAQDDEDNPGD